MSRDVFENVIGAPLVRRVLFSRRPRTARMNGIPRRALIFACARTVAVLAEAVAHLHLVVPDWLEPVDEQVLSCFDPSTAHNKVATVEIGDVEVGGEAA